MDTTQIRDRNYKMVESVRQQNMREQRRLSDQLYSRQGMSAAHKYELASMSYEQKKLKEELARIQKSTPTTQGKLPPRKQSVTLFNKQGVPLQRSQSESKLQPVEATKAREVSQNRIDNETKKAENTLQKFNSSFGVESVDTLTVEGDSNGRSISPRSKQNQRINDLNVKSARTNVLQRLGPSGVENHSKQTKLEQNNRLGPGEQSRQHRTLSPIYESGPDGETSPKNSPLQVVLNTKMKVGEAVTKFRKLQNKAEEENEDDPSRYNPDGSLRTMYKKQDFMKSISEAKKARYIRHKEKQWFEKELTVQQIFEPGTNEEGETTGELHALDNDARKPSV